MKCCFKKDKQPCKAGATHFSDKYLSEGAGDMSQQLRMLVTLEESSGLVPSTHVAT